MLTEFLAGALAAAGVTEERVTEWLGFPCGCEERRRKLERLEAWAARVAVGKLERAAEYLRRIIHD